MKSLVEPADVMTTAARMLAEHLGVDRCAYAEIIDEQIYDITGDYTRGVTSIVGQWPVVGFGELHLEMMRAGEAWVVSDVDVDPRIPSDKLAAYRATSIRAVICVPLHKQGVFTAAMAVHCKEPRVWQLDEVELVTAVCARCWEALARLAAERALALSRARLEYSTRIANVGFWYCDLPFDVLQWDARVKSHFWLPPDATVTIDRFYELIHPEDRELTRAAIDDAINGHRQYDVVYRTVDPVSGAIKAIRALGGADYAADGTPIRFDGVTVDVTEHKRVEQQLRDQDRAKDAFLAMLAHELRNPLAPLRTGIELLEQDRARVDRHLVDRALGMMKRQLGHMVHIIDDLLDISRITLGKIILDKKPVELADAIASAIETTAPLVEQAQLVLTVQLPAKPVPIDGDATRLVQVFANLVNNAAKYTPAGGSIRITGELADDRVVVRIADTGIGIPHDMLEAVFDMYTQVPGHDGLGIGLTLARRLVELHGGTIVAERVARGSSIAVTLPVAHGAAIADAPREVSAPAGLEVLVVDDNRDAGEMLGLLLEQNGNRVRVVEDGPAALRETSAHVPDVVILDIGLPGMTGYEVARAMRDARVSSTLIALTGWGADRDRQQAREAGFDHHLVKPVDFAALAKILEAVKANPTTRG